MKDVTKRMIEKWKIDKIDFMGYEKTEGDIYTFHHLIVPNREGGPIAEWNGAILFGNTSHPYLHQVEYYDYDRFLYITSLLIDENILGRLDLKTLREIDNVLKGYEREFQGKTTRKGKTLIKEKYTIRNYEKYF